MLTRTKCQSGRICITTATIYWVLTLCQEVTLSVLRVFPHLSPTSHLGGEQYCRFHSRNKGTEPERGWVTWVTSSPNSRTFHFPTWRKNAQPPNLMYCFLHLFCQCRARLWASTGKWNTIAAFEEHTVWWEGDHEEKVIVKRMHRPYNRQRHVLTHTMEVHSAKRRLRETCTTNDLVSSTENLWENWSRACRLKEIYQPIAKPFGFWFKKIIGKKRYILPRYLKIWTLSEHLIILKELLGIKDT